MSDAVKTNSGGSRLIGKLLLPGFADAGASTSFQPTATSVPKPSPGTGGGDQVSEAATEIRDNRSSVKQQFRMKSSQNKKSALSSTPRQESSDSSTATSSSNQMTPSSHGVANELRQNGFFPNTTPQRSPRPDSPPAVSREQHRIPAAATSASGTSVAPAIGASSFSDSAVSSDATSAPFSEKENQKRIYYWQTETPGSAGAGNDMKLNATTLQRAAAAVGGDFSRHTRRRPGPRREMSDDGATGANRDHSLIQQYGDNEDTSSDVMSTASEMGTVIETGNHAAKMAEIDAMAALIEASPNIDTESLLTPRADDFPIAPSRTPSRRGPAADTLGDLAMPTLDSQSTKVVALAPHTKATETSTISKKQGNSLVEEDPKMGQAIGFSTRTEMLTSALRRLGTGLSMTKASLSAPPTPRSPGAPPAPRVEDLLRSSLTPGTDVSGGRGELTVETRDLPASLALRSPGSSARFSLRRQRRDGGENVPILAPRFSSHDSSRILETSASYDSSVPQQRDAYVKTLPSSLPTLSTSLKLNPMSPFRLAQQCLSYDSTIDELHEAPSAAGSASSSHVLNLESYPMRRRTAYDPRFSNKIHESVSWDVSSASAAFRAEPHRSFRIGGLRATESQIERNQQRERIYSDFSPRRGVRDVQDAASGSESNDQSKLIQLRTPERFNIDVEREDALDILSCLVERGTEAWNEEPAPRQNPNDSTESASQTRETLISTLVQDLRNIADERAESADGETAAEQVDALEELLKAHSYALEMKRAARSASSWLKSIGRGQLSNDQYLPVAISSSTTTHVLSEVGQASGETAATEKVSDAVSSTSTAVSDTKIEMLTLKARLHSAENELREKAAMNQRMDEELAQCRAEIGRLRTAVAKNEATIVHNKSMVDNDDDDETVETEGQSAPATEAKEDGPGEGAQFEQTDEEENKLFDESFQGNNSLFQDASILQENSEIGEKHAQENLDMMVLKTALDQANDTIRLLHEKLHNETPEDERKEPPIIGIPYKDKVSGDGPKESSESSGEHGTVNVRMLNSENFITEWDNLTNPLPPPPDHGLRSPIVHAVLEQWTDDPGLHNSLLTWMERVMTGNNLEGSVPPLTISSLDHQVRDGFVMHVLPLLLRRADIHVRVKTRAHRSTIYDLAVSVQQTQSRDSVARHLDPRSPSLLDQHTSDEHDHPMMQKRTSLQPGQNEDLEYSHFNAASENLDDGSQPTFIGAIGGALGGLLSRGRYASVNSPPRSQNDVGSMQPTPQLAMPSSSSTGSQAGSGVELDNQPYHRVVSAPPGRIGITFVEYRGHAMVADMAPDSPLASWVYPSDILIAVDEVPVSGMRVRDIIKILTNRKDRQRALRVISSHAMNEFTLNQSAMVDEAP